MTPQEEFQLMLDRSGLTAWHKAEYRGQGVTIFNCEPWIDHGAGTGNILKLCSPDANILFGSPTIETTGDILVKATVTVDGINYDFAEYIKANKVDIISTSLAGNNQSRGWIEYCEKLVAETGVVIFNSAGNGYASSNETLDHRFPASVAILVGAVNLKLNRISYSSVGEELDFMAYAGLISGTSAACPFLVGMTACAFSKYGKMSPAETKTFLKSISLDLGAAGDDIYYGEGMPTLGNPETIIKMWPGKSFMTVDGNEVKLDQAPEIKALTGRTQVPIRAIAEAFGAKVDWDKAKKEITIVR